MLGVGVVRRAPPLHDEVGLLRVRVSVRVRVNS